jgi:WD40 repeat protein
MLRTALLLLVIATTVASAQLSLSLRAPYGTGTISYRDYPKGVTLVRATLNGSPIQLTADRLVVIENHIATRVASIEDAGNGYQRISWITTRVESVGATQIVATVGGFTQTATGTLDPANGFTWMVVRDSMSRNIGEHDFGVMAAGDTALAKLKVAAIAARAGSSGSESSVLIDSITTTSPNIEVIWKRTLNSSPPPTRIQPGLDYRIDVIFRSTSSDYFQDVLTVHFEGGRRASIMLKANKREYPIRTVLKVVEPNGGEAITPCQKIPIRWTGAIAGYPTTIEWSPDGGETWQRIGTSEDTTITWTVPATLSDRVLFRVSQDFQQSDEVRINGEQAVATNVAYSLDGRRFVIAYMNGTIQEWDVATLSKSTRYTVPGRDSVIGLTYIGGTGNIAALTSGSRGRIYSYQQGVSDPLASVDLPSTFKPRDIASDDAGTYLYVLPSLGPSVLLFTPTLQSAPSIEVDAPISAAALRFGRLSLMTLDGIAMAYAVPANTRLFVTDLDFVTLNLPYTREMSASVTGRFIALGTKAPEPGILLGSRQSTFVYDLQDAFIARSISVSGSDAVGFSFSANEAFLAMGFEYTPQLAAYDIARNIYLGVIGAFPNGQLADLEFSPDGKSVLSCALSASNNGALRQFITPESDVSDGFSRIVQPAITLDNVRLATRLIGVSSDTTITASVCNRGEVPFVIESTFFRDGTWLTLLDSLVGDTLQPGQCASFRLRSIPNDTGDLFDSLELVSCGTSYLLPISQRSIDRSLALLGAGTDFGEICIGEREIRRVIVIRNDDPISVRINAVYVRGGLSSQFRMVRNVTDTLIPAGASLELEISFEPRRTGLDTGHIVVEYADQSNVTKTFAVYGRGKGADVQLSHQSLPFLPEIPTRTLTIVNPTETPTTITAAIISAGAPFIVNAPLPLAIGAQDSVTIDVQYQGGAVPANASLTLTFDPCANDAVVPLTLYDGEAVVRTIRVEADPRGDAVIPIIADITERAPYSGERTFEGVILVHPRLFLARTVSVTDGDGVILSQDITDDVRQIRFRLTKNFRSGTDTICVLRGPAGLAEIDSTVLAFDTSAVDFSSIVPTVYGPGLLKIKNPDPGRHIVDQRVVRPMIERIFPQPAIDAARVRVQAPHACMAWISVVDAQGQIVIPLREISLTQGANEIDIDVAGIVAGTYAVTVSTIDTRCVHALVVMR